MYTDESIKIPLIDFSRILNEKLHRDEMTKLHAACEEWGFFLLINHGSEETIEKMKNHVEEFFKQPLEKRKLMLKNHNIEGYGQSFVRSEDQKLNWADMEILERYSTEVNKLAIQLMGMMAENLGLEANRLTDMLRDVHQTLRMNYYPPCPQADKVVGISPHSDPIALTLLIESNNVQGLQIRKDCMWVPVHAIPGAFIINIGDMVEIWSNGKYKSIEHRVVVNHHRERLSVAVFHSPNNEDAIIGPLPELVKEGAKYYKSTDLNTYYELNSTLQGKKHANIMKLVNPILE
ncbi:hypothetical protein Sjap_004242 [Stephania japonica]|uniref:Fe2OG dioxygenase domain-containing protein n=1 Tax=Stephania japonica TaxID=461633 RepID=A0AAP0PIW6_9MAGN